MVGCGKPGKRSYLLALSRELCFLSRVDWAWVKRAFVSRSVCDVGNGLSRTKRGSKRASNPLAQQSTCFSEATRAGNVVPLEVLGSSWTSLGWLLGASWAILNGLGWLLGALGLAPVAPGRFLGWSCCVPAWGQDRRTSEGSELPYAAILATRMETGSQPSPTQQETQYSRVICPHAVLKR